MALATLSIDLVAKLAALEQGFDQAARLADKNAQQIQNSFERLKSFVVGIGAGIAGAFSADAFKNAIKGAIDYQDHLNDLAKSTQLTVLQIGGVGFAASQAGSDVEGASASVGKLNLTIAKAAAGNKEAVAAFDAVGVSVKDAGGKTRDTIGVLVDVATKFAGYSDGPGKAALANALFGKSYQSILSTLDDGGKSLAENIDYFQRYSGITAESAAAADQFNDTMGKLNLLSTTFKTTLANELLPTLQSLADLWLQNKEKGDQFRGVAADLAEVIKGVAAAAAFLAGTLVATSAKLGEFAAKAVAVVEAVRDFNAETQRSITNPFGSARDGLDALSKLGTKLGAITDASKEKIDGTRKAFDDFYASLYKPRGAAPASAAGDGTKTPAPSLPKTDAAGRQKISEADKYIAKLTDETISIVALGDASSETEKALFQMSAGKLQGATDAQKAAILDLAAGIDKLKMSTDRANSVLEDFRKSEILGTTATNEGLRQSTVALMEAFHELVQGTPTGQMEELQKQMVLLSEAFGRGEVSADKYTEAMQKLNESVPDKFKGLASGMQKVAESAAQNITDTLGTTVEDVLGGHFDSIGDAWKSLLISMAAQAIKTDLGNLLFGSAASGSSGGSATGLLSSFLGMFGASNKAGGGSVQPMTMTRVNETGVEGLSVDGKDYIMTGGTGAKVTPAGRGSTGGDVIIQVAAGVQRNELVAALEQQRAQIMAAVQQRQRRPGYA